MSDLPIKLKIILLAMKLRKMFVICKFVTNQMKPDKITRGIRKMSNVKVVRDNLKL